MAWRKYIYVYETDIVSPGINFTLGDVKIESFDDERDLNVASNLQRVALLGKETMLSQSATLHTNKNHTTILLTARTKQSNIFDARKICTEALDQAVALLGNIYHSTIFDKRIYNGWDYSNPLLVIAETSVYLVDKIHEIDQEEVATAHEHLRAKPDAYSKMAKLYAQAASMPIGEEKFVKLWTILEIFPLETAPTERLQLEKLYELLRTLTGRTQSQIKKLKIHHEIYDRYRCEIVHTGSTGFSEIELKDTTEKLEAIVRVVMRYMMGLKYEDELGAFIIKELDFGLS